MQAPLKTILIPDCNATKQEKHQGGGTKGGGGHQEGVGGVILQGSQFSALFIFVYLFVCYLRKLFSYLLFDKKKSTVHLHEACGVNGHRARWNNKGFTFMWAQVNAQLWDHATWSIYKICLWHADTEGFFRVSGKGALSGWVHIYIS